MNTIVTFGAHVFDVNNQVTVDDNFSESVPQIIPLPGLDGGFSNFADGRAPAPVGRVSASIWVHATPITMVAALDDLRALSYIGFQYLTILPEGVTGTPLRRCFAVAKAIRPPADASRMLTQYNRRVNLEFVVPEPYWESVTRTDQTIIGSAETTATITAGGTVDTLPLITVAGTAGAGGITIERLVGSTVADRIVYAGSISDTVTPLVIDVANLSVTLNGVNAYDNNFSVNTPRWLALAAGANNIRITPTGTLEFSAEFRWRGRYK